MVHRIVTTFRIHMNAISDGEEIKYRYLVSEWVSEKDREDEVWTVETVRWVWKGVDVWET